MAHILTGFRTAVGKANKGGFRFTSPVDLAAHVIDHMISTVDGFDASMVDDLIVGNAVPEAEQGLQMGRWVGVRSKLPITVPGFTINRYCGSGVEAIALATAKIKAGMAHCIIAGGTESMSLVPTVGYKTVPNYAISCEHPDYYIGMGLTAEEVGSKYKVSREEADQFSFQSHQKAIAAIKAGRFKDEIVPVTVEEVYFNQETGKKESKSFVVDTDEGPREDTSVEVLSKLRPVFRNNGLVTAGNSSQTSDGASFVMVVSDEFLKRLSASPIGRYVSCAAAGVDPRIMGIGPVAAIPKALEQAGMSLNNIQQIELNEAFASQSLAVIREAGLNPDIVNPNGGAIALGHPLGCTGTKLTVQILNEMKRRDQQYGMVTACIGGGQGIAAVVERY